jgi:hypothetical protein
VQAAPKKLVQRRSKIAEGRSIKVGCCYKFHVKQYQQAADEAAVVLIKYCLGKQGDCLTDQHLLKNNCPAHVGLKKHTTNSEEGKQFPPDELGLNVSSAPAEQQHPSQQDVDNFVQKTLAQLDSVLQELSDAPAEQRCAMMSAIESFCTDASGRFALIQQHQPSNDEFQNAKHVSCARKCSGVEKGDGPA